MAETVGSLIDKLTIVELRRWHTEEAMLNPQASVAVRHTAALRLHVIDEQRSDLASELDRLWADIVKGRVRPKIYRQLKMYNDAEMRNASRQSNSPKASSDCDRRPLSQPTEPDDDAVSHIRVLASPKSTP